MNILIPDSWLKEHLQTQANSSEVAKYLSLCGPSVERVDSLPIGPVYNIEITTNRIDSASVYGIAREAAAILPRFNLPAKLLPLKSLPGYHFISQVDYLQAKVDSKLCPRFTAVVIRNTRINPSPKWLQERLVSVGIRPLNNIVDISNYLMVELGQPMHTFDYDKIKGQRMILRPSLPGETIITLDDKIHTLAGGDIVIEDGDGRLIDLAGIMGGALSAVDSQTKNVLLFVQTYDPRQIRKTSMSLAKRTAAAEIFEKGVDPELADIAIKRGIGLFKQLTGGVADKTILDIYPKPFKPQTVKVDYLHIKQVLGVTIEKTLLKNILTSLGFGVSLQKTAARVIIPSWRVKDVSIPEDVIEEIARIYGYFNLPSQFMSGALPEAAVDPIFELEAKIKNILKGYGLIEIYSLSLVPQTSTHGRALKLKNPLGQDSEYLRTSLRPSLQSAIEANSRETEPYGIFEIANVYLPQAVNNLPEERLTLAGIFRNTAFRQAKGKVEALLEELNIDADFIPEDRQYFTPGQSLVVKSQGVTLGYFGVLENEKDIYFEFPEKILQENINPVRQFKPLPKFPPQIEDLTLIFPAKTEIGKVCQYLKSSPNIIAVGLTDIYADSYTFRINYFDSEKTLTDTEVKKLRSKLLSEIKHRFGGYLKE